MQTETEPITKAKQAPNPKKRSATEENGDEKEGSGEPEKRARRDNGAANTPPVQQGANKKKNKNKKPNQSGGEFSINKKGEKEGSGANSLPKVQPYQMVRKSDKKGKNKLGAAAAAAGKKQK